MAQVALCAAVGAKEAAQHKALGEGGSSREKQPHAKYTEYSGRLRRLRISFCNPDSRSARGIGRHEHYSLLFKGVLYLR